MISPANGAKASGAIQIYGIAAIGKLPLTAVLVRIDNSEWRLASGLEDWSISLDSAELTNGKHRIEARAFDGTFYSNATSIDIARPMKAVPIDFEVFNLDARVPPVPTYNDAVGGVTVRPELTVDAREDLTFSLRVDNAGTKPMPSVLVRAYDVHLEDGQLVRWNFFNVTTPPIAVGDKFVVGEAPFSEGDPPLSWTASVPGEHTLEFKVFLDHQSSADDDVASVVVTVKAPPPKPEPSYKQPWVIGTAAATAAILVAVGYVLVVRRKPTVDMDLYGSIYGADFADDSPSEASEV